MHGRSPLPVPNHAGVYSFPTDILSAHKHWQNHLQSRKDNGLAEPIELIAPFSGGHYLVEPRASVDDRPILALEPHHDDLTLSAGGYFLAYPRPLTIITVFTRSTSVHPDASHRFTSIDDISSHRAEESYQVHRALSAATHLLGLKDADPPYRPYTPRDVDDLLDTLRPLISDYKGVDLIAPAAVTRHPDHLLIFEVAVRLGCHWFWDDTAFYPTYAGSVDDQCLFELRTANMLTSSVVDISDVVLDKLTLLHMYQSQMQPVSEMYRVLRYNWTVAARMLPPKLNPHFNRFGERFFRTAGARL